MKTNGLKILFFVTEDWFVCSHWLPLIEGSKNAGFEVVVVTQVNKHSDEIRQHGARVVHFGVSRRGANIFVELGTIIRLMKIYREEQPDIVHHIAMKPMLYGSLVSHLLRVPHTVNWVAGMGWVFVSKKLRTKILQILVRNVLGILLRRTSVIVENKDDKAIIISIGVADQNIHLVRGAGVDSLLYQPSPEPDGLPLVVLPARMLWDKGVGEFVNAARLLKQRGVKARFVLVGEPDAGNPATVTEQQLKAWQTEKVVEWWGRRNDMPQVLAQCHIVCLPSYREGLPKSLLEAASCGRPIVTTDVPGCREIVSNGQNGYLVEARNASALASALSALIADPKLRQQMGQNGRERVLSEFTQEKIVAQVLDIYGEMLS